MVSQYWWKWFGGLWQGWGHPISNKDISIMKYGSVAASGRTTVWAQSYPRLQCCRWYCQIAFRTSMSKLTQLTHRGLDKMDTIWLTTFSNSLCRMKIALSFELTRLVPQCPVNKKALLVQIKACCLNLWWPDDSQMYICVTCPGLNVLEMNDYFIFNVVIYILFYLQRMARLDLLPWVTCPWHYS